MEAVILAGGLGTRLAEETSLRPKPMVEIGGRPILWHLLKNLSSQGVSDFVICLGYKGYVIKEYFANYWLHVSDIEVSLPQGEIRVLNSGEENWRIKLVDTGETSQTGQRLRTAVEHVAGNRFLFTYGDGLSDVSISRLVNYHHDSGRVATVTAVRPPGRFGALVVNNSGRVEKMEEKPEGRNSWINGGFFILEKSALAYLPEGNPIWEQEPLEQIVSESQLTAYQHEGFWHPMDTLRDKNHLESLWNAGNAPWKNWA